MITGSLVALVTPMHPNGDIHWEDLDKLVPMFEQVEAFWDAYDTRYFGLRLEEDNAQHARVIVTDEIPEDEEEAELCIG